MNIGIVCWWFNRGQATVGRYIRSIFDELGHNTFVLARLSRKKADRAGYIDSRGVWRQPRVTPTSRYEIPFKEYRAWTKKNSIDVAFFDQNDQFEEIAKLRASGIKTIGRFVWESFSEEHVRGAMKAFDIIYSLTQCEQLRYQKLGINSVAVSWGCHPELSVIHHHKKEGAIYFFYPGGYLSKRKPTRAVIEAFSRTSRSDIRLIIKAQTENPQKHREQLGDKDELDPRITVITDDLTTSEYYRLFASCHVCLAPSRWEGLGLHLYEAAAFGIPVITNDNPPMNELVKDGYNGLLVRSHQTGRTPSGISAYEPDIEDLSRAIHSVSHTSQLNELSENMRGMCKQKMSWEQTIKGYRDVLEIPKVPRRNRHGITQLYVNTIKKMQGYFI